MDQIEILKTLGWVSWRGKWLPPLHGKVQPYSKARTLEEAIALVSDMDMMRVLMYDATFQKEDPLEPTIQSI